MTRLIFMLILAACISPFTDVIFAQDDAMNGGTLRGQITDVTLMQNPIKGVEVKIVAQDGGKEWTTKTDADGNYTHVGLPAGRYLISISKEGYDKRVGKSVTIVDGGDHFVPLKMAHKGNLKLFEVQPREIDMVIKQQNEPLLQGVAESMGARYDLDETAVESLYQSMLNSIDGVHAHVGNLMTFANADIAFKMLLAQPDCKAAFAEHLSEAQLQDYSDFIAARLQREQEAVALRITAALDRELSLTAEQREKVAKLLRGAAWNGGFPSSINILRLSAQKVVHLVHYRLKIVLDGILNDAQSKVWQGLIEANPRNEFMVLLKGAAGEVGDILVVEVDKNEGHGVIHENPDKADKILVQADVNKKRPLIRMKEAKNFEIKREVNIVVDAIDLQEKEPGDEINADTAESQAQMIQHIEAKLAAHTELLGALDERAARRLSLVANGVAQQFVETQSKAHEALGELSGDGDMTVDITDHPMYQQAIKDVLSEEAFAAYRAYRAERETFQQQALRDLVVACTDTQLLLDDTQREVLKTAASQLVPGPLKENRPAEFMFFQLFPQTVNFEILTLWQQGEFKRVFGPMLWRQ